MSANLGVIRRYCERCGLVYGELEQDPAHRHARWGTCPRCGNAPILPTTGDELESDVVA